MRGLTQIDKDVAQELAQSGGALYLRGLNSIDGEVARMLAKSKGPTISLGLKSVNKQVAKELVKLRNRHEAAKNKTAELWAKIDFIRLTLLPEMMDDLGTTSMKIDGVGRLGIGTQATCKTLDKEALFQWLHDHDHEDIITPAGATINASTLKSFINNQIKDGEEIPDEKIIDFGTFSMATITKV